MNEATRTPLAHICGAVGTLGSALIALAVGVGAVGWLIPAFVLAGAVQAVYATQLLRGAAVKPQYAVPVLLAPTVLWLASVLIPAPGLESIPLIPMLTASSLAVSSAVVLALHNRAGSPREPNPLAVLPALGVTCLLVATATTFALSGTLAGEYAVPHGEHGLEEALHDIH